MKPPKESNKIFYNWFIWSLAIIFTLRFQTNFESKYSEISYNTYFYSETRSNAFKQTLGESIIGALIIACIRFVIQEKRWETYRSQFPDGVIPIISLAPPIKYTSSRTAIILAILVILSVAIAGIYIIYY